MIALSLNVGGVVRLMKLRYYGKPIHMHEKNINIRYRYEPGIVFTLELWPHKRCTAGQLTAPGDSVLSLQKLE